VPLVAEEGFAPEYAVEKGPLFACVTVREIDAKTETILKSVL
jgi:hypothetical protein